jgi:hypothetical protein
MQGHSDIRRIFCQDPDPEILVLGINLARLESTLILSIRGRSMRNDSYKGAVDQYSRLFPGLLLKLTIYCFMASYTLSGFPT